DGYQLGPDLVTVQNSGKEKLLTNIIDPNREIAPQYLAQTVETTDGESVSGVIVSESASTVTVRMAFGKEAAFPRNRIAKLQSQGQSLMPEGLEAGLTPQDVANLLEFIITTR
ncbi:MAG TPA: hypothetical protein VK968_12350, partial [Roseimicrobium sp.]|nr:hypothetical protein [Roseimicrobium sp.]